MEIKAKNINCELKFERDELMRLFTCISLVMSNLTEQNYRLYQQSVFYLGNKIGATLEYGEKQIVDSFATNILKINKSKLGK